MAAASPVDPFHSILIVSSVNRVFAAHQYRTLSFTSLTLLNCMLLDGLKNVNTSFLGGWGQVFFEKIICRIKHKEKRGDFLFWV